MFHPGVSHLLSLLREKYWILRGRELCKKVGNTCLLCHKRRVKPVAQLMADLPDLRFKIAAFKHVSVDLFGPFKIRLGVVSTRGAKTEKRYGVIFTCLSTRAVHVTPVESLSTAHFLNSLRVLESVRGRPDLCYSDNGLNFVGAAKELIPVLEPLFVDVKNSLVLRGIKWQRYTPLSPHFGGVHEALVKSVKRAIYASLEASPRLLSDMEFVTLLAEVTGLLNSRPLTYVSSDPADVREVLTPNSFLMPRAVFELHPGVESVSSYGNAYVKIQTILNDIWKRWQREYLPTLITREKWRSKERDLTEGDLVLLVDDNLSRGKWRMGRVINIFRGNRGHVRSVTVKTATGNYERPAVRCCLLLPTDQAPVPLAEPPSEEPRNNEQVQDGQDRQNVAGVSTPAQGGCV